MNTAVEFIKRFEGCRLNAYQDSVGIWTIGYGQTGPTIGPGLTWTIQECEDALYAKVNDIERQVRRLLEVQQTDNQQAALISFAYNLGVGAFHKSTLLQKINDGKTLQDIADEFLKWNKAGGKVLPGLTKRRQAEHDLYLS